MSDELTRSDYEKLVKEADALRSKLLKELEDFHFGKNPLIKSAVVHISYFTYEGIKGLPELKTAKFKGEIPPVEKPKCFCCHDKGWYLRPTFLGDRLEGPYRCYYCEAGKEFVYDFTKDYGVNNLIIGKNCPDCKFTKGMNTEQVLEYFGETRTSCVRCGAKYE